MDRTLVYQDYGFEKVLVFCIEYKNGLRVFQKKDDFVINDKFFDLIDCGDYGLQSIKEW